MALLAFLVFIGTFIGAIMTFEAGVTALGIFFLILSVSALTYVGIYLAVSYTREEK